MTTIKQLLARRDRTTPGAVLADDSLQAMRYECVRSLSPHHFAALHRSAILHHGEDETFARAFDRVVDVLILTEHAREKERTP